MTYGSKTPMIFDHLADRNLAAYRNILTPAKSRFEPGKRKFVVRDYVFRNAWSPG